MGQKVNPNGMRLGVNRNWNTRWFANNKDYSSYLIEDIKIREFVEKQLKDALLSHVEIERKKTNKGVSVLVEIYVARPGVVIGENGTRINTFKAKLAKLLQKDENLRIEVIEVKNPNLDANLVGQMIAKQLEERVSFRIAQKKAIQLVKRSGAKGIKTLVSGRLGGAEIARGEGYKDGVIPLHTLRSDIDYAWVEAHTTYGRLGVKVWICRGETNLNEKKNTRKGE